MTCEFEQNLAIIKATVVEPVVSAGGHQVRIGDPTLIQFWPRTGRWIVQGSAMNGRGVFPLIEWLKTNRPYLLKEN